ncbi:MAG: nucleotide exchange factor GrpE [Gemmatimonadota bacterium]
MTEREDEPMDQGDTARDATDRGGATREAGEGTEQPTNLNETQEPMVVSEQTLEDQVEELKDRYLRLAAEFDNYRRRVQVDLRESGVRGQAALLGRLLESLDDLERVSAMDAGDSTVGSVIEGVRLVEQKILRALEEAGSEILVPSGEPFDPEVMEALMRVAVSDPEEDDRVDQVFQRGFRLKGQLVRPARVSVRKLE